MPASIYQPNNQLRMPNIGPLGSRPNTVRRHVEPDNKPAESGSEGATPRGGAHEVKSGAEGVLNPGAREGKQPPWLPPYPVKRSGSGLLSGPASPNNRNAPVVPIVDFSTIRNSGMPLMSPNGDAGRPGERVKRQCERCVHDHPHMQPFEIYDDEPMCAACWHAASDGTRVFIYHHNNDHTFCGLFRELPESEYPYLAKEYMDEWKAEWKHTHGDHSLCQRFLPECEEYLQIKLDTPPHVAHQSATTSP